LRRRIVDGHPVDPGALEGWAFRGINIGPPALQRLTWRTFQKTFHRDRRTGRLVGWNVRLHQDGENARSRPLVRDGRPRCVWYYEVIEPRGVRFPRGFDRGLIIDYGRGGNRPWQSMHWVKDPLVALEPGDADHLLGVSYVAAGRLCVETPTYFVLEREHPIEYVPEDL
jgi:hypothetical protein